MILKICGSEWDNASRDKRELSACRELGQQVMVLAKGKPEDRGRVDEVDGFEVRRYSTRPLGNRFPSAINQAVSLFCWAGYTRRELKPQIISGHDLIGLSIGWLSNIGRKDKAKLIYDSHEFELGRNADRNKLQVFLIKYLERFLIKRCAFSIMVNDSIADEVQKIHKLKQRPIVVRSTPEKWTVDPVETRKKREELLALFPNSNVKYLLMFHGNLGTRNGMEFQIPALQKYDNLGAILMGKQVDKCRIEEIQERSRKCGVDDRLLILPPVHISELWKYSGAVDVEMMTTIPSVKSHYFVLPNKLFESIQAETPIVAADLPEMRRIVDEYHVGIVFKPGDADDFCACLGRLLFDDEFYYSCKKNMIPAKNELCWEKEKLVLQKAYLNLLEN